MILFFGNARGRIRVLENEIRIRVLENEIRSLVELLSMGTESIQLQFLVPMPQSLEARRCPLDKGR